jgi:hypothetical protein
VEPSATGYLVFVWAPTGYLLSEREGELPAVGSELEDDDRRLVVSKIGASPLPGDHRKCVYLQGA